MPILVPFRIRWRTSALRRRSFSDEFLKISASCAVDRWLRDCWLSICERKTTVLSSEFPPKNRLKWAQDICNPCGDAFGAGPALVQTKLIEATWQPPHEVWSSLVTALTANTILTSPQTLMVDQTMRFASRPISTSVRFAG